MLSTIRCPLSLPVSDSGRAPHPPRDEWNVDHSKPGLIDHGVNVAPGVIVIGPAVTPGQGGTKLRGGISIATLHRETECSRKGGVALPAVGSIAWNRSLCFGGAPTTNKPKRSDGKDSHGRAADAATNAQGRLEDHVSPVSVHGREFCGQDRGRSRRRAHHERTE